MTMYKKILLFLIFPFLLAACNNTPESDLFHLTLGTEADADIAMGLQSAEITINGYARWIEVGMVGDIDSYTVSDAIPDWLKVSEAEMITTKHQFRINVSELVDAESRIGKVVFTVFKGNRSQTGSITVIQNPCTLEDLKKTERRAMNKYLSKFDVVEALPSIPEIQVGSVAPFYKLDSDGSVYMQVVRMGTEPAASRGEKIFFRYLRYDLLYYLDNGVLPPGQGNANSMTDNPAFFEMGSDDPATTRWGTALQLPMQLGLPVGSEVNLVVAAEAGPESEINNVIPFLYNIRYLNDNN